ncbi:putative CmcJ-like methyltransferase [Aspergillus fumigatus Af293]|uniref:CmcJ-like methyltransferase, putative n=2 Tax=Aspergillus fumigatus TaxID=746128 RepID=Q4WB81_ASPFU|nr:CmcJ-like methyltransferase, putative [Aspergillus fumigatus Af293]EAL85031.1 CmcJ-like methyltransferase, putative [Aspergillus fumigatus Af293]EDP49074.1 CmcJ-like methyltransferase, putative [Aspergillus fumigatus A1163]
MDDPGSTVQASMFFLTPDELHKQQRPYTFKFPPYNGCPQSNMTHEKINGITVENMRGREDQFQLERNGFTILKVNTGLEYDDFFKQKGVTQYLRLMEGVLKARLGANGTVYEYDQPTTVAHVDEIRRQYGKEADGLLKKRFQWINFWKPLRGPVNDWPLVLCDSSLIDVRKDLAVADLLYPDLATENQVMYYRDGLKWYYLSDHEPSEIIVFKQMDSLNSACPGRWMSHKIKCLYIF